MEMICIVDNGKTYRVRKENVGCSIFGSGCFIEGDDVLFDVLKAFAQEDVEEEYRGLLKTYQVEERILKRDLWELAIEFEKQQIFEELAVKIRKVVGGI